MKNMMLVAALVAAVGFGCTKKKKEEGTGGGTPAGSAMGSAPAGSAAGSGSAAAAAGSGSATAVAKAMTPEDMAKRVDQCWGYYNDAKWDDFKGCYAADAVVESPGAMPNVTGPDAIVANVKMFKDAMPDDKGEQILELINGHNMAVVSNTVGTNTGTMKTPMGDMPPSKNKVGGIFGQIIELGDDGKVKHEWDFADMGQLMGQMKPDPKHPVRAPMDKAPMAKEVVIAKDDAGEKANADVVKKLAEAFSKHDAKAVGDLMADDAKWSDQSNPKDSDKKEMLAHLQGFWKAFSDVKITPDKVWAGGDYVVAVGTTEGTNDGDLPQMGLKKTGKKISVPHMAVFKLKGGKIENAWLIGNSMAMMQQLGMMPPMGGDAGKPGDKKDEKKDDKKDDKKPADKKPADKKG